MESLFDMVEAEVEKNATIEERALAFHQANPKVYEELRRLALTLHYRGHKHFGVKMLFEQMRWQWAERTSDMSGFKLNNNYSAFYARLLMKKEPELFGTFNTRATRGDLVILIGDDDEQG